MKKLYFIRHAKSSWEFDVADEKRPLNDRGLTDAKNIGFALKDKDLVIDLIITSPAVRASTTAAIIQNALGITSDKLQTVKELYDFSGEKVLQVIHSISDTYQNVLIFGHNHAFTTLANTLGSKSIQNVPTAGVVVIEFDSETWSSVKKGKTVFTLFPKELRK